MRYSKDHKSQTRQKIVQVASKEFRKRGFDGIAISDLMSELELTHGGFYRHFPTKESLYAETLSFSIEDVQKTLVASIREVETPTLRDIITQYLSFEHAQNVAGGCPVAALSADVARQSSSIHAVFEQALASYMARFMPLMKGKNDDERRRQFLVLFSGMAGTLSVARAVADEALRASLLQSAREFYINTFCE